MQRFDALKVSILHEERKTKMAFRIKEVDRKTNETYVYEDVYYDLDVLFDLIKVYQKVDRMNPSRDVIYIIVDEFDGHTCYTSR